MEGHSHYSERQHETFLERFKGRFSTIDRTGQLGIVASCAKPIEKSQHSYSDVYRSCACAFGGPYASPEVGRNNPFVSSTLRSTQVSSEETTSRVLSRQIECRVRRPKYYTPMNFACGCKKELDSFSRMCDSVENSHRTTATYSEQSDWINPLRSQATLPPQFVSSRASVQMAGRRSLNKDTQRYASHGKFYIQSRTGPARSSTIVRQKTYANPADAAHYDYAMNGAYIVAGTAKGSYGGEQILRYGK